MLCRSILRTYHTEHDTEDPPARAVKRRIEKAVPQTAFPLLKRAKKIIPRIVFPALFALDSPRPPHRRLRASDGHLPPSSQVPPRANGYGNPTHNRASPAIDKTRMYVTIEQVFSCSFPSHVYSSETGFAANGWYHTFSRKNVRGTMQPVANGGVEA